ncbi:MAG: hypothetical protein WKF68_12745 [Daejeonella sp.]
MIAMICCGNNTESNTGINGIGGIFRFSGQFLNAQRIITIGSQPYNGFPNLSIDNLLNVTAETGNLHVNNILDFVNGNLILNNVDVNVGRNGLGTITGYSASNFIVTGPAITGGSLGEVLQERPPQQPIILSERLLIVILRYLLFIREFHKISGSEWQITYIINQ